MIVIAGETANTNFTRTYSLEELLSTGAFVSGPSRTRLQKLGLDLREVRSLNLCSPGRWDPNEACMNARRLVTKLSEEVQRGKTLEERICYILAFGARCSMAFGLPFIPLDTKVLWSRGTSSLAVVAVSCPHPSGLSRWWNDENNVFRFQETIRGLR